MAETGLQAVARKAMSDPAFWKKLRSDPDSALKDAGMQLAAGELDYLRAVLRRGRVEVDVEQLMRNFHGTAQPQSDPKFVWLGWIIPPPPPGR
jgi:hypothetical protein